MISRPYKRIPSANQHCTFPFFLSDEYPSLSIRCSQSVTARWMHAGAGLSPNLRTVPLRRLPHQPLASALCRADWQVNPAYKATRQSFGDRSGVSSDQARHPGTTSYHPSVASCCGRSPVASLEVNTNLLPFPSLPRPASLPLSSGFLPSCSSTRLSPFDRPLTRPARFRRTSSWHSARPPLPHPAAAPPPCSSLTSIRPSAPPRPRPSRPRRQRRRPTRRRRWPGGPASAHTSGQGRLTSGRRLARPLFQPRPRRDSRLAVENSPDRRRRQHK